MPIREAGDRVVQTERIVLYSRKPENGRDVVWDSISNLKFKMTEGSILTGGFIQDESCAGNGGSGTADPVH